MTTKSDKSSGNGKATEYVPISKQSPPFAGSDLVEESRRRAIMGDDTGVARYPEGVHQSGRHSDTSDSRYRRPDREIHTEIAEWLERNPTIDASQIILSVAEGKVMLRGRADSLYAINEISEAVRRTLGVEAVENNLEVHESPAIRGAGSGQTTGQRGTKRKLSVHDQDPNRRRKIK
ncbi:MAG: BON domain-containing protein [Deltaproteobacteria bacterium]|nr:BON domain-containing protein [Deltaproteobacteria bacterium]